MSSTPTMVEVRRLPTTMMLHGPTAERSGTGGGAMFACANRVKMPQVGDDDTNFASHTPFPPNREKPKQHQKAATDVDVSANYLKKISMDINFAEEVVEERCMPMTAYSDKYFHRALDISDIVPKPPKAKYTQVRYNARGADKRHQPCHLQKRVPYKLKPLKRKILQKAMEMHKDALQKEFAAYMKEQEQQKGSVDMEEAEGFFLTQAREKVPPPTAVQKDEWDKYLMTLISDTTAQWIVAQKTEPGQRQDNLTTFLTERYGRMDDMGDELIKDSVSESEYDGTDRSRDAGKWKKADETLLDRVRGLVQDTGKPTDPYSDDHQAAFYRLPAGQRRAKKHYDKQEEGAINATAHGISVVSYTPPPNPTLMDYINPAVGDKVYSTDNAYTQEWLIGHSQVATGLLEDPNMIKMTSNNRYKKQLQEASPRSPDVWCPKDKGAKGKDGKKGGAGKTHVGKVQKGLRRWKELPQPIDTSSLKSPAEIAKDTAAALVQAGDKSREENKESRGDSRRRARNNSTLVQIAEDWRSKWHLDMRYADATPDDLIRDMADLHVHIRLKAITTCARAAEYKPPPQPGILLEDDPKKSNPSALLPPELFVALECCLEDENEQVKRAAAIALYTLEKPTSKAEQLLRVTLKDKRAVDRWTAGQCLAYYGECDSDVVGELIWQLMHTEDPIRTEQAGFLLSRLSENSTLVHSMIGEQLNNSSWRTRIIACRLIPKLHGQINKDLVHKLSHLMWNDYHAEMRKAAAQTLGRTGHGKDVHDELIVKIQDGAERVRLEAISKLGYLGLMTAKLLPAFLECFQDPYVSVRCEVCIACLNLNIKDDKVLDQLVYLATYDTIWKVKALAIQALGHIGEVSPAIRAAILWAFRYEDTEGVRAEACHAMVTLRLTDGDVAQILQDRYLVETSSIVKDEIRVALELLDISPTEDMDMVARVKGEVRKLCTKTNIAAQITLNDRDDDLRDNIDRMIYIPPEQQKERESKPRYRAVSELVKPGSAGSRPWSSLDDGTSSTGSRALSRGTDKADREIQDIIAHSRQGLLSASSSSRSEDGGVLMLEDSRSEVSSRTSRAKSQLFVLPEEEEDLDEAYTDEHSQKSSSLTHPPKFHDTQAYVEVVGGEEEDEIETGGQNIATSPPGSSQRSTQGQSQKSSSDINDLKEEEKTVEKDENPSQTSKTGESEDDTNSSAKTED